MNHPFTSLQIAGRKYEKEELLELSASQLENPYTPSWQRDTYLFIRDWLSEEDHIEVSTSGSTGSPKSIRLQKQCMINSARLTSSFFRLDRSANALLCLPVKYIAGKMMIARAFVSGCNLLVTAPKANPFKEQQHKVDFAAVTPYQMLHSLDNIKSGKTIKTIIAGGGEINAGLEERIREIPVNIFATYGMTETCSHIALRKINGPRRTSWYRTLEGVEISKDERSCLVIDASHLSNTVIITNDIVEIKDERHFKWLGRWDNVINSGGIKIFPEQIEKIISGICPERVVIVPVKDKKFGNIPVLVVESGNTGKLDQKKLAGLISKAAGRYSVPKKIYSLPAFPETPTGKPDRKMIARQIKDYFTA